LRQFNLRPNELTWNSNGVLYIDQISIPNSNIFELLPLLFKAKISKNKKNVGFEAFVKKIFDMNLDYLILSKNFPLDFEKETSETELLSKNKESQKNIQWWYIGD